MFQPYLHGFERHDLALQIPHLTLQLGRPLALPLPLRLSFLSLEFSLRLRFGDRGFGDRGAVSSVCSGFLRRRCRLQKGA